MSYSLVELSPNEKVHLEINDSIQLESLIKKVKENISVIHIFKDNDYQLVNVFPDGSFDAENFELEKESKIILENGNKNAKILIDFEADIKEISFKKAAEEKKIINLEEIPEKSDNENINNFLNNNIVNSELKHWCAESIKTINIPYEKQSLITGKFREKGINSLNTPGDNYLSLIEECSSTSTTGNISFRFFFVEGKNYLRDFHYQLFLILKKYIENLIISHKHFKESHYILDIFVFVNNMSENQLGSAMIHKYVKNEENDLILPTKAVMKINSNHLSTKLADKINVRLMQTLFHEIIHCLGFGYWDLFGKNLISKNYSSNDGVRTKNIISIDKTNNIYRNIFRDKELLGIPLTEDCTHFSTFNSVVLKNSKLYGVLPGMKYELMSNNDTELNVFSKLSASVIESLGYKINYKLCDEYPFSPLPTKMSIEYSKITDNHFAKGLEKYILLLKYGKHMLSGIETYSMKENSEYVISNNYSYSVYVTSALEENEKYLLGEKEGVFYGEKEITISPNNRTPNLFYIISSITFGGIPIVKISGIDNVNSKNCFNHNSLKKLTEEFIEGKSPRLK